MFSASRSSSGVASSGRSLQALLQHAESPGSAAAAATAAAVSGSPGAASMPHLPSLARGAASLLTRGLHGRASPARQLLAGPRQPGELPLQASPWHCRSALEVIVASTVAGGRRAAGARSILSRAVPHLGPTTTAGGGSAASAAATATAASRLSTQMAPSPGITSVLSRLAASRMRSLPLPHQQQQRLLSSSGKSAAAQAAASSTTSSQSRGFLPWYMAQLEARPVTTKALTSCTVFTLADITSQYLAHALEVQPSYTQPSLISDSAADGSVGEGLMKDPPAAEATAAAAAAAAEATVAAAWEWDALRTMRMGAAGLILSGPTLHVWYGLMARWRPGRDLLSICQKILVGTVLYGPVFNAIFFSANGALQGEGSKEIAGRLRRDLLPTLVNGLMYWPFCDLATYRFVPVHLQGLGRTGAGYPLTTCGSSSRVGAQSRSLVTAQHHHHIYQSQDHYSVHQGTASLPGSVGMQWAFSSHLSLSSSSRRRGTTRLSGMSGCAAPSHSPFSTFAASPLLARPDRHELGALSPAPLLSSTPSVFSPCGSASPVLSPPWGTIESPRTYVQLMTVLNVADNSGAKTVMCIKVLKGAKPNTAAIGDIIIASVKTADFHGKVKKGEVVRCVVVRAAMPRRRVDGSMIRFDGPAAVVINKAGEPTGTRVFGPVPHELRGKRLVKVLALAQNVV